MENAMSEYPRAKVTADRTQVYADVTLCENVVLELVGGLHDGESDSWEVWGVRIDGQLYREPRDLEGDRLAYGPFFQWLDRQAIKTLNASRPPEGAQRAVS
jgi:hypothetical protein